MKTNLLFLLTISVALAVRGADDWDQLKGKWSLKKTNGEGQTFSQHLDISEGKLSFEVRDSDDQLRLIAKGRMKLRHAGPLTYLTLADMEAGDSPSDLKAVDDERTSLYLLRDDRLHIASNFDKERRNEPPSLDIYSRSADAKETSLTTPPAGLQKLLGTWNMELSLGDNTVDYKLKFQRLADKLSATLISPRSGEHAFKKAEFKDGDLNMEIDREIEGKEATLRYTGKLSGDELSGKVTIADGSDRSAKWKATR